MVLVWCRVLLVFRCTGLVAAVVRAGHRSAVTAAQVAVVVEGLEMLAQVVAGDMHIMLAVVRATRTTEMVAMVVIILVAVAVALGRHTHPRQEVRQAMGVRV